MESDKELFGELEHIAGMQTDTGAFYAALHRLVQRTVGRLTEDFGADFSCMAARIYALCRKHEISPRPLLCLTAHAKAVARETFSPSATDMAYDLKAACEALASFLHTTVPPSLHKRYPGHWRPSPGLCKTDKTIRRMRLTVTQWDGQWLYGTDNDHPESGTLKVCYASTVESPFAPLHGQLFEGAQVNLLSVQSRSDGEAKDTFALYPETIVLEPDFLVDITTVCACIRPHGTTPLNYLLNKFAPSPRSTAIRLGNTANEFLDDCVNEPEDEASVPENELYTAAMQRSFRQAPLDYTTLDALDANFFKECRTQFTHIRQTVKQRFSAADIDIASSDIQLEPSFLCEALGLQGRMDLLADDFSKIVELKSGKAEEYPGFHPQEAHALQMALYREMLHYGPGIPYEQVQTYLFYSKYPYFYNIYRQPKEIAKAIALRNGIVHIERTLRNGGGPALMGALSEETFNTNRRHDRFYETYLRPSILNLLRPLQNASPLEAAYFHTFLAFTEREQFLAKTGDGQPDSGRGFAETWNADTQTKRLNGNILTDLSIEPVTDESGAIVEIEAHIPDYTDDFLPNFRQGDMVMLYERNGEKDTVVNRQVFRCTIEEICSDRLLLKLAYRQRHTQAFHRDRRYAVEPGHMDSTFTQAYRGLFAFLTAPVHRRQLLLGQTVPRRNETRTLNLPVENPDIARIVLRAKQAEDYFLLVGPPGTGKTSVALKAMVEEFLSETPSPNLLLTAYTNRAVDEICEMLESIPDTPAYVRIGMESSCSPRFRPRLIQHVVQHARNRQEIHDTLRPIRLFVGTLSSLSGHPELFALKRFDTALIDEASQILEPQLLPLLCAVLPDTAPGSSPSCAIRRFILIGDHKQLPAVVVQSQDTSKVNDSRLQAIGLTDCACSLFERLHRLQNTLRSEGIVDMLHRQGRMHPDICQLVNDTFYNGRLDVIPLPHQQGSLAIPACTTEWEHFIASHRTGFFPTEPSFTENPKINTNEACIIASIVETLLTLATRQGKKLDAAAQIGIIVPFRNQIASVRKSLAERGIPGYTDMTIDTVERYQGSQRDIILYGTTISRSYQLDTLSAPVLTDNQWIDRKLNVALTRARKQFFLIGYDALLRRSSSYLRLLESLPVCPRKQ